MRTFDTGATRDSDDNKIDYDGFLSPYALRAYGEYMLKHQVQADGSKRTSDNWQKGIPITTGYMKSLWRHFMDVWMNVHNIPCGVDFEEALTALFFNVHGMLHEIIKKRIAKESTITANETAPFENNVLADMVDNVELTFHSLWGTGKCTCGVSTLATCPIPGHQHYTAVYDKATKCTCGDKHPCKIHRPTTQV